MDALTPAQLASLLEEAILDVIDVEAYESELVEEERDLEAIAVLKKRILKQQPCHAPPPGRRHKINLPATLVWRLLLCP